jgi:hypothetical protein
MPWTAKTRAAAWRRVNAEPDTPRSVIAAELGVSAKALRDLIKEKEGETGTRAKRVKRGRPLHVKPKIPLDFLEVAREVLDLQAKGFPEKRLASMRRAYLMLFGDEVLPAKASREMRLLRSVRSTAALALLFRVYGWIGRHENQWGFAELQGSAEQVRSEAEVLTKGRGIAAVSGRRNLWGGYDTLFATPFAESSRWVRPPWREGGVMWLYIIGVSSLSKTDGAILREGRKLRDSLRRTLRKMKAHPETKAQALALIDLALAPSAVQVKGDEPNIVRVRKPRS